ncbi:MAG: adenylosuccinate synthase [Candidatus Chisholmbacteria bacterium RIFCSPLOWO2_01_FULL_50_28]|uniref:Adenylosuccinate synthetase n=1 Tax=Candidatus Chisholmbacteria bacterium RIFCSPHIGHO2_01_FULL_52_32 TaxID=1797591 RepID=A0A1G1VR33_9BACT|nr:MAG: adenylosuccinate synthase [Candidatus Chisholmbacteria bacterium RIFCSPHIGHO2_01_FULL_52_32]OGY19580.1 MAG: adenylosuccinate synthase [Candidatus Chisholmbacteria bacterium RIFCSPLOWO2_01_FULL_50_28]
MPKVHFPLVVIGAQWGDEGKGKLVDVLAQDADLVVRFNGGNNAGHTVTVGRDIFKLSLLPSGVVQKKHVVIAQGCVVDPQVLLEEIALIKARGLPLKLSLDPRVHVVMPYHKALDRATELWKGKSATGSLHLGIGYCYEDKNNRFGIRMDDLLYPAVFREKLRRNLGLQLRRIRQVFGQKESFDIASISRKYLHYGKQLKQYLEDTSTLIENALQAKTKRVLFEGAHGTLLDPVFGTYPYTVAIHTISGSIFPYVGISPRPVSTLGVVKAYTTRVGNGPFPTELTDATGAAMRTKGGEFGTVSKRPRRCGWLDLPALRTSTRLSGYTALALTKLDVLSGLSTLKVCVAYKTNGKRYSDIPVSAYTYGTCTPVYTQLDGWQQDISACTAYAKLPATAKGYIRYVSRALKTPVAYVSVGPKRSQVITVPAAAQTDL